MLLYAAEPRFLARLSGALAAILGATVLTGWIFDVPQLRSAVPFGLPMRANAAAAVVLAAATLLLLAPGTPQTMRRAGAALLGLAVAALALATLSQDLVGWDLGIDHLIVRDETRLGAAVPGRMSPPTSFSLALIGIALIVGASAIPRRLRTPSLAALGATVILIGGIALLGQLTDRWLEIRFLNYSRIAVYAAAAILLLGCGIVALARADGGLHWSLDRATTAGFAVGMLAMVIAAGVSYQFTSRLRDDAARVNRTQERLKELQSLNAAFGEFTISAGRYLITRDERTLDSREALKQAIRRGIERLRALVREPAERAQLERIEQIHARRIALSDGIIADYRRRIASTGLPAATEPSPLGNEYPALGVEIERTVRVMLAREYAQLEERERQSQASSAKTFLLLPLGVLLSLALLSLALFFLNWGAGERRGSQEALRRTSERLRMLHEIDQAIISAGSLAQIAEAVLPRFCALLGLPRAAVSLFDEGKREAEWLATASVRRVAINPGERFSLAHLGDLGGLQRGEIQLRAAGDSLPPEIRDSLRPAGVAWYAVVPMRVRGKLVGSLNLGGPKREFSAEQLEIAKEVAAQLAIAFEQTRLDERARRADAYYRLLFENVPVGITMTSTDGAVRTANPLMAHMIGYASVDEALEALGGQAGRVYVNPQARQDYLRLLMRDRVVRGFEAELRRRDGSTLWVTLDGKVIEEEQGRALLVTIVDDVTLRRQQEEGIARLSRVKDMKSGVSSSILRAADRGALLDAVCRVAIEQGRFLAAWVSWHDADARLLRPLASAGRLDGFLKVLEMSTDLPPGAEAGMSLQVLSGGASIVMNDLRTAPGVTFRQAALARGYRSTMHLPLTAGGQTRGVLVLCAAEEGFFDAEERQLLDGLAADVSFALESLDKSERLDYLAYYDSLTGLPNRSLFHDRLAHSLHARGGERPLIAVILLDLERFQRVNETHGRQGGDELLREIGSRLQRANDSAARLGGNLFALVLRSAHTASEVNRALEAILAQCFAAPVRLRGSDLRVACRAGIAVYPGDGADADELLRNAEAALRLGKGSGERIVFYAPEMNARVAEALAIETRLRQAWELMQFVLHYQPKVLLDGGRITGLEALIRWKDPGKGLVPPGHFIPVLEETGLIVDVGRWAIARACLDQRAWREQGLPVPRVAVNVSAIQLQRKDFIDAVIEEIQNGGDTPEGLELEITESLMMRNVEDSIRKLSILRGMGVTVAIDDFGTGYSSLGYLSRLPVDSLKIDRSFIVNMAATGDSMSLVTTIIALARGLRLKVVAEGVETEEQAKLLRLLNCDEAQGYYFARPSPAGEIARLLRTGGVLPAV